MKIFELAKELNVTPKELISFLRSKDFSVSSHMQKASDEMIDIARKELKRVEEVIVEQKEMASTKIISDDAVMDNITFSPDDEIPCKSVTPWKLSAVGVDKNTVYHWEYFGDVEYLKYRDLQALRRTEYITKPNIIIMDANLRKKWARELGDIYKYFDGIEYPEEYFDMSDYEFENLLKTAPNWLTEIIKTTAMAMVRAENYPATSKIIAIDRILNTCIKDFL